MTTGHRATGQAAAPLMDRTEGGMIRLEALVELRFLISSFLISQFELFEFCEPFEAAISLSTVPSAPPSDLPRAFPRGEWGGTRKSPESGARAPDAGRFATFL